MVIYNTILFIFGVALGSFLNVVASRYKENNRLFNSRIIGGRSHCSFCKKTLAWYELVPIFSFFIQKGRCRYCGRRFSFQYPLVELAGGFALLLPYYFQYQLIGIIWTLVALAMILIVLIDRRLQIIPDQINLFLAFLGAGVIFLNPADILVNHLFAGFIGLLFFGVIILISRGRAMGMGDMKLAGAMGLLLGWPNIILAIATAFVVGAAWGVFLILSGRKKMKSNVPFGPFLVIGFFTALFWGSQLISWYFAIMDI